MNAEYTVEQRHLTADEDLCAAELKMATLMLRDTALAHRAAQERYQTALAQFNRTVAPDPNAK